ncbi:helix-turn-helix domain-containing protein [Dactylosporangium sp. CA-092794]|uniref:helix-turn-helix domain-containing protein n=1 Tax=Dactylosporangium sp. CA-092794 TaxID=3239929 RepID=UPI003D8D3EC5
MLAARVEAGAGRGSSAVVPVGQPWATGTVGCLHAPACGCDVAVARWTGREIRMLREALRLSVRAFAERLGMAVSTVQRWEDRHRPSPPSQATQSVLDDALRLAGVDARTRFRMLVLASLGAPDSGVVGDAGAIPASGGGAWLRVAS